MSVSSFLFFVRAYHSTVVFKYMSPKSCAGFSRIKSVATKMPLMPLNIPFPVKLKMIFILLCSQVIIMQSGNKGGILSMFYTYTIGIAVDEWENIMEKCEIVNNSLGNVI